MTRFQFATRKKLYKNSRQGKICGIFSGLGDYLGLNPLILRLAGILAMIFIGPVVMILGYLLVSLLLDDKSYNF